MSRDPIEDAIARMVIAANERGWDMEQALDAGMCEALAKAALADPPSCEGWLGLEVYTSADFTGHYPVGASAVVVAHSEDEARELLGAALKEHGLKFDGTLRRINIATPRAFVLTDGDY